MDLLSILNTGTQGLAASQLALQVTGQNISNANTDGYSRKKVDYAATSQTDGALGQVGTGVTETDIQRMRDGFIDTEIRDQNQQMGLAKQNSTALSTIENVFTEPSDNGLQSSLDKFFTDWQDVANNPSDIATRTTLVADATTLTDQFHSMTSQLSALQSQQNDQITQTVSQVNDLLQKISDLNKVIGSVQLDSSQKANDSLDQRDQLITQLSQLVPVNVSENAGGQVTISSNGIELVSPQDCKKLETCSSTVTLADGSQSSKVAIRVSGTQQQFIPAGGELKGLFDNRDTLIPSYQAKLDTLAKSLVTSINTMHKQGYTLNGDNGISFFNDAATGASTISLSAAVSADVRNIAAAGGGPANTAVANTLAAGMHNFGSTPAQLYRDPAAVPPVAAQNIVKGSVSVMNGTTQLAEGVDYSVNYATGTIQMLSAGYDSAALAVNFSYQSGGSKGPGDSTTALAIANLQTRPSMEPDSLGNSTATFTDYYSSLVGQVGSDSSNTSSQLDARKSLIQQLQTQQSSVSGVSLDEEMSNLINYQHTYQAAAQLISIANKMLDALMAI